MDSVKGEYAAELSKDIQFLADTQQVKISNIDISKHYIWVKYNLISQPQSESILIKRDKLDSLTHKEEDIVLEKYKDKVACCLTKNFAVTIDRKSDNNVLSSNILNIRNEKNIVSQIEVPLICLNNATVMSIDINLVVTNQELDEVFVEASYLVIDPSNSPQRPVIQKTELFLLRLREDKNSIMPLLLQQNKTVLKIMQNEKCLFICLDEQKKQELLVFDTRNGQHRILATSQYEGSDLAIINDHVTEILEIQPKRDYPDGETFLVKSQVFSL